MPAGREVCFQQACLTCRIAKVSAKDGKRNSQTTRCAVRDPGRLDFTSHQRELLDVEQTPVLAWERWLSKHIIGRIPGA